MMESLRSATRNTAFDRWLASTMSGPLGGGSSPDGSPTAGDVRAKGSSQVPADAPAAAADQAAQAEAGAPAPSVAAFTADGSAGSRQTAGSMPAAALAPSCCAGASPSSAAAAADAPLAQVAEYLAAGTPAAAIPGADAPPSQSLSGTFRPGWEVRSALRLQALFRVQRHLRRHTRSDHTHVDTWRAHLEQGLSVCCRTSSG